MFLSFTAHVQKFHILSRAGNVFKTKHEKQNAPPFYTNILSDRRHFLLFDFRKTDILKDKPYALHAFQNYSKVFTKASPLRDSE